MQIEQSKVEEIVHTTLALFYSEFPVIIQIPCIIPKIIVKT